MSMGRDANLIGELRKMKINEFASKIFTAGAIAMGILINITPAEAAKFSYEWDRPEEDIIANPYKPNCTTCFRDADEAIGLNDAYGEYEYIKTTYNTNSELLTWESTFTTVGDKAIDGGWLVISDGPNPKGDVNEYAIFYLDGVNERLTAYAYDGKNWNRSWQEQEFLGSWDDALTFETFTNDAGEQQSKLNFNLDVTSINEANITNNSGDPWIGTQFEENLGIWFHAGHSTLAEYFDNGEIESFSTSAKWYDTGELDAESVPEPATTAALIALVAVGGTMVKRKRS